MAKKFTIRARLSVTLTDDQIWPDGDKPENPTTEDVAARIDDDGGFANVLNDWNLRDFIVATVAADGEKDAEVKL